MMFSKFSVSSNCLIFLPILLTHTVFHRGLASHTFMLIVSHSDVIPGLYSVLVHWPRSTSVHVPIHTMLKYYIQGVCNTT